MSKSLNVSAGIKQAIVRTEHLNVTAELTVASNTICMCCHTELVSKVFTSAASTTGRWSHYALPRLRVYLADTF